MTPEKQSKNKKNYFHYRYCPTSFRFCFAFSGWLLKIRTKAKKGKVDVFF